MNANWFLRRPLTVFLDNSVFVANHFDFGNAAFDGLKAAVSAGHVEIVCTEISAGEFKAHAARLMEEALSKFGRLGVFRSKFSDDIDGLRNQLQNYGSDILWEDFKSQFGVRDISSPVNWSEVFEDYFHFRAPFSLKKKTEFPDAFNLKMLKSVRTIDDRVVIISGDGDYSEATLGQKKIAVFKTLGEFIDRYLKIQKSDFAGLASAAFNEIEDEVAAQLAAEYSDEYHYELSSFNCNIDHVDVGLLTLSRLELVNLDGEAMSAIVKVRFKGSADLSISCNVTHWDSVDREDVHLGTNRNSAEQDIVIEADVEVSIDPDDLSESTFTLEDHRLLGGDVEIPDEWTSFLELDPEN